KSAGALSPPRHVQRLLGTVDIRAASHRKRAALAAMDRHGPDATQGYIFLGGGAAGRTINISGRSALGRPFDADARTGCRKRFTSGVIFMTIHPLAGKPAPAELLIDIENLRKEYYTRKVDIDDPNQRVSFGTSGHRGSSLRGSFNEEHILAITQALCEYRTSRGITGPLYIGKDT